MPTSVENPNHRADLVNWLKQRQSELKVTTSTVTPSGQTLDWVPVESQAIEPIATPPPVERQERIAVRAEMPTEPAQLEQIQPGPAGHVPILRPDISRISANVTLEQFLSKKGGLKIRPDRKPTPTDPNPAGYFHASSGQNVTSYGCDAWLNVWDPQIDVPSSPGDDHSISQTWLQNGAGAHLQSLEGGLTVDQALNGDRANHIFTYYTTNAYSKDGNNIGGYNRLVSGWRQYHPTIFPGIRVNGASTQGGGQLEIAIKFQLWQGNWWFGVNNNESGPWIWIGYYPASLFASLASKGDWVSFGGEVYSALPNPCTTKDQMGSGRHAETGWTHAAYQRLIHVQNNAAGALVNFNGNPEVDSAAANCPANQYDIWTFMNSGTNWGSYQFYGGQAA